MKKCIKTVLALTALSATLSLASCGGRVGEDVYDGDEYTENLNDGITSDEERYNNPSDMLDMSPDSTNMTK